MARQKKYKINPIMRFWTIVSWSVLLTFIVEAFVFVIGQEEYGLWANLVLTQQQRNGLSLVGTILVAIVAVITIMTDKPWRIGEHL